MTGHADEFAEPTATRRISVHIDRLVIDGLPVTARHGALIREALHQELQRLLQTEHAARALDRAALAAVTAPPIVVSTPLHAADLGRQIALSLYTSLRASR